MLHFKQENQSQFSFCLYCIMLCELVHAVVGDYARVYIEAVGAVGPVS